MFDLFHTVDCIAWLLCNLLVRIGSMNSGYMFSLLADIILSLRFQVGIVLVLWFVDVDNFTPITTVCADGGTR